MGIYRVSVSSTRPEIVDKFYECVQKLGLHCGYELQHLTEEKKAKMIARTDSDIVYRATLQSKRVWRWMRPYKYDDFHFTIPDIVFTHKEMAKGFLQGFFDAEGGVYPANKSNSVNIQCWSKHISNLEQVQRLLAVIGIKSYAYEEHKKSTSARLTISDYDNRMRFRELVGFRIKRKMDRLNEVREPLKVKHSQEIKELAESLIKEGKSGREIADITKVNIATIGVWRFYMNHPEKNILDKA